MGADLSMNPPRPAEYVALFHTGNTGLAVYKFPGEMERESRVWHRVYRIFGTYASECSAMLMAMNRRPHVISDTVEFSDTIDPNTMRELLNPRPVQYKPKHA